MNATNELYMEVGTRIKNARESAKMTQAQLAAALNLSRTSVTNIEKGRQHLVLHTLYAIANVVGKDLSELLPPQMIPKTVAEHLIPEDVTPKEWHYIEKIVSEATPEKRKRLRTSKGWRK